MTKTEKAIRALKFCRVIDGENNISLTNLALMAALVRTLMIPSLSVHDLLIFLGSVASYQFRRFAQPVGTPNNTNELEAAVAELQTKMTGLQMGQQMSRR